MQFFKHTGIIFSGISAGAVNGLFGGGGGMVLVPLLTHGTKLNESEVFPASVAIILPICVVSLLFTPDFVDTFHKAVPYLLGSTFGGVLAGIFGKRIPVLWLHRGLGLMLLWGGIRYLC